MNFAFNIIPKRQVEMLKINQALCNEIVTILNIWTSSSSSLRLCLCFDVCQLHEEHSICPEQVSHSKMDKTSLV